MKEIPLSQGLVAFIDDEDYERVNQYKWSASKCNRTYYARRSIWKNGKTISQIMHRFIMNASKGIEVNHWDHNGLNNQKENLILSTHQQNGSYQQKQKRKTSSKYKGVFKSHNIKNPWKSLIMVNQRTIYLGYFKIEEEAAKAYDNAALLYFGEFAYLNFPKD